MHSVFIQKVKLCRFSTSLCYDSRPSYVNFSNKGVVIDNKGVTSISKGCFNENYIGPGGSLSFKSFITLEKESVTSPLFKDIIFENDASIDVNAFFSRVVNSNLYKNYTLYCYKGSKVEQFALKHGFTFKELSEVNIDNHNNKVVLTSSYRQNIRVVRYPYELLINEDRVVFIKTALKRNVDYIYYQTPFIRNKYSNETKLFIEAFLKLLNKKRLKWLFDTGNQKWLTIKINKKTELKYMPLLEDIFKNTDVINYIQYFKKEEELC